MRLKNLKRYILLALLSILFSVPSIAQNTPPEQVEKALTTSNVYVLSNRKTTLQNRTTTTLNRVKTNTNFDFLRASIHSKDSVLIERTDSTQFLSEISLLAGDWVVFVHGDAKTLEQSIIRGIKIKKLYDVNVLIFSWPSRDSKLSGVRNFKMSQSHVDESINHFVKMLRFVERFKETTPSFREEQKISLFFHSLGNLYVNKWVTKNLHAGFSNTIFDNVILNAAAVNQKGHKEWVEQINIQKHLFIICNKQDFNLKGVRIFTSDGKQLGEKIKPPLAINASYIHFNKSVGFQFPTGQSHTYFIGEIPDENKNIKELYHDFMHGQVPDFSDENKFLLRKDNLGYEILSKKTK